MNNILFVANGKKDKDTNYSKRIIDSLFNKGLKIFVDNEEFLYENETELATLENLKTVNMMIVLGGDGTILTYARKYEKYNFPIMGINLGRVGALAVAELDDYDFYIDKLIAGDYVEIEHIALDGKIMYSNGKSIKYTAYNDVVIHRGLSPKILKINIAVNNSDFSEVYTDGIIVATPTGSSAYNLSAGGPLLSTNSKCYVITPICPQSKTFSSLVVSKEDEILLTVDEYLRNMMSESLKKDLSYGCLT